MSSHIIVSVSLLNGKVKFHVWFSEYFCSTVLELGQISFI